MAGVIAYEFDSASFTLAGLAVGTTLAAADAERLRLHRAETVVDWTTNGNNVVTLEIWENDLGLQVQLVDALVFLVDAESVSLDGVNTDGWGESDFIGVFGMPTRREQPTGDCSIYYWQDGAVVAFFSHFAHRSEVSGFYISEPE